MATGHAQLILLTLLLGFLSGLEGNNNDASASCVPVVEKLINIIQMVSEKIKGKRSGEEWSCDSIMQHMISALKTVLRTLITLQKQKMINIRTQIQDAPCDSKLLDLIHLLRKIAKNLENLQKELLGSRNKADSSCSSNIGKLLDVLTIISKTTRKLQKIIHKNECDAGWTEYRGLCFLVKNTKVVYDDAVEICRSHSATVAFPTDKQSNEFIRLNYAMHGVWKYWLGIRKIGDTWQLADGTAAQYTFWRGNEPNGCCTYNVTCVMAGNHGKTGAWEDVGCRERKFEVMCQHAKQRSVVEQP